MNKLGDSLPSGSAGASAGNKRLGLSLRWGTSLSLALALSVTVLGVVIAYGLLAAGVQAQEGHPVFTVNRFEGDGCSLFSQGPNLDPNFLPGMSCFRVDNTGPAGETTYEFFRPPFSDERHRMWTISMPVFYYFLHDEKG